MRLRPSAGRAARLAAVLAGTLALGLVSTTGTAAAAPATRVSDAQVPVCSATPSASGLCKELTGGGTAAVVDAGSASYLRFTTPTGASHATVHSTVLTGRKLKAITTLSYQTLIESPATTGNQLAPSINVAINPNEGGATFATLVWEPIYTRQTVVAGQWQTWTPTATVTGAGGWWSTKADPLTSGQPNKWGFNSYTANFADVLAALPNATILDVAVNQGSGSPGLQAGVDQFRINGTTYDFENPVTATKVVKNGGDNQSATALTPFAAPLRAKVTGRDDLPAANAPVTFTVAAGATFPGGAKTATVNTNANGVATSPQLTAGAVPGPVTVTATSGTGTATYALTVTPPAGPPSADLAVSVTGLPATAQRNTTFTATIAVQNTGPSPTTNVRTVLTAPAGLRITAAPGAVTTPNLAVLVTPTLAAGATATYPVTFAIDATPGPRTLTVATTSAVRDPNTLNNIARPTLTVT